MLRIVVDEGLRDRLLQNVAARPRCQVGAIVGRRLPNGSRIYCLLAIPIPMRCEETGKNVNRKDRSDSEEEAVRWACLADVSRRRVELHIKQLTRLLVGGLSVCGLYAITPEPGTPALTALKRLWPPFASSRGCRTPHEAFAASPQGHEPPAAHDLAWLHVNASSRQFTWRVGPPGGEMRPGEVTYQARLLSKFVLWHSVVHVDLEVGLSDVWIGEEGGEGNDDEKGEGKRKAVVKRTGGRAGDHGHHDFGETFWSTVLRAGYLEGESFKKARAFPSPIPPAPAPTPEALRDAEVKPGGGGGGGSTPSSLLSYAAFRRDDEGKRRLDFYAPWLDDLDEEGGDAGGRGRRRGEGPGETSPQDQGGSQEEDKGGERAGRRMWMVGSVVCVAVQLAEEDMVAAVAGLKADYARTLLERVQLLREGRRGEKDGLRSSLQLPRRVFLASFHPSSGSSTPGLPSYRILLGEYLHAEPSQGKGAIGDREAQACLEEILRAGTFIPGCTPSSPPAQAPGPPRTISRLCAWECDAPTLLLVPPAPEKAPSCRGGVDAQDSGLDPVARGASVPSSVSVGPGMASKGEKETKETFSTTLPAYKAAASPPEEARESSVPVRQRRASLPSKGGASTPSVPPPFLLPTSQSACSPSSPTPLALATRLAMVLAGLILLGVAAFLKSRGSV